MSNFIKHSFISLCLLVFSFSGNAIEIQGLYDSSVPVTDQSRAVRKEGFKKALEKVLIKITGSQRLVEANALVDLFPQPESFVVSFTYIENPDYLSYLESLKQRSEELDLLAEENTGEKNGAVVPAGYPQAGSELVDQSKAMSDFKNSVVLGGEKDGFVSSGAIGASTFLAGDQLLQDSQNGNIEEILVSDPPDQYLLRASFSKPALDNLLSSNGVSVWGKSRPSIIVWLVAEQQGMRSVLNEHEAELKLPLFSGVAEDRGLHVYFPVADLEDQINTDVNLLWGMFEEGLPSNISRYNYDVALIMTLQDPAKSVDLTFDPLADTQEAISVGYTDDSVEDSVPVDAEEQVSENDLYRPVIRWKLITSVSKPEALSHEMLVSDLPEKDALTEMFNDISEILASKYSVTLNNENSGSLQILISGVDDFKSFIAVQSYIRELPPISKASLTRVGYGSLLFEVNLFDTVEKLQQYIDLGGRLHLANESDSSVPEEGGEQSNTATLVDNGSIGLTNSSQGNILQDNSPYTIESQSFIHYIWKDKN